MSEITLRPLMAGPTTLRTRNFGDILTLQSLHPTPPSRLSIGGDPHPFSSSPVHLAPLSIFRLKSISSARSASLTAAPFVPGIRTVPGWFVASGERTMICERGSAHREALVCIEIGLKRRISSRSLRQSPATAPAQSPRVLLSWIIHPTVTDEGGNRSKVTIPCTKPRPATRALIRVS